ncbi:unnamed protein product [Penicillium pancosmium]
MKRLDTALDQLATSTPTPEIPHPVHDTMSAGDAARYIEDAELLRAVPYIIDSSHAQVSPAMRIIYLNAIYRGQTCGNEDEYKGAASTYYKCLQSVPSWLSSAQGSQMDLIAASLTSWTAIDNFDYHLAWKFHSEACRFSDLLGIQDVETPDSDLADVDAKINDKRRIYWHLVTTDCLYMLWYDKPSALNSPVSRMKLPVEISPRTKQPKFSDCVLFIVWSRALSLLEQFFDHSVHTEDDRIISFQEEVDSYCNQLEDLVLDWDLLSITRSSRLDDLTSWLFVDSIVAFYSCIIYMRRKTSVIDEKVHSQAVRAARNILAIIIEWLATFYPFCAFFTLYYHILSSTDSDEYEDDIQTLEKVVQYMTKIASVRPDFVPLVDAMRALNEVSRAAHSYPDPVHRRTGLPTDIAAGESNNPEAPCVNGRPENGHNMQYQVHEWNQQQEPFTTTPEGSSLTNSLYNICLALPSTSDDESIYKPGPSFQFENPFPSYLTPPQGVEPGLSGPGCSTKIADPLEYVHAMETSFQWRNWHEHWWNSTDKSYKERSRPWDLL